MTGRRQKSEIKYYGMAAAFVLIAAIFAVYISTPLAVKASPEIYVWGELRVAYADGSVERILSPKTMLEKTAISLQDFFKGLSALERGGKEVDRIQAIIYVEGTGTAPVVAKTCITVTAGSYRYADSAKQAYVLEGGKAVELWSRVWSAEDLAGSIEGTGALVVAADVYAAAVDGVYHAAVGLSADLVKAHTTAAPTTTAPATELQVTDTSATAEQTGGTVQPAAAGAAPQVQGMTPQEYTHTVEQLTGRTYTDQVTVEVAPGGYQPEPGTLAAQDQYAYDVTNFWLTYRETGKAPEGWTISEDRFGQTVATSPNGNSLVGNFKVGG